MDDPMEQNSYGWFSYMSDVVKEKEESGEIKDHQIGIMEFD
jgi:hypothetical protein